MISRAKQLLSFNVLENITLLKMLETYGDQVKCKIIERDYKWGVLLCLPTKISYFDHARYPESEYVVFVGGTDIDAISDLINELQSDKPLVFKIQKNDYKYQIEKKFKVRKMSSFYTYSCNEIKNQIYKEVVEEDSLNEILVPLWSSNGYSADDLQRMFKLGAKSYSIYKNTNPASTCITFHNYGVVWEIGAVYTSDEYRGNGYAKKVVHTAINQLVNRNLIPRYQVVEDNIVSIKLAESLGLSRMVTLDHLYYEGL